MADVPHSQTGKRRRKKGEPEPVPDLWDPATGTQVPVNPGVRKHKPTIGRILDVDGKTIAVKKMVTVSMDYSSSRIDARNLVEILEAPSLWEGRNWESIVQHAVCVLKIFSVRKSDQQLELFTEPATILRRAGLLDLPTNNKVLEHLTKSGFLKRVGFRQDIGRVRWLVNPAAAGDCLAEPISATQPSEEAQMSDSPAESRFVFDLHNLARLVHQAFVEVLRTLGAEEQSGWLVLTTNQRISDLVADKAGKSQARTLYVVRHLRQVGSYESVRHGPKTGYTYRIMAVVPVYAEEQLREANKALEAKRTPATDVPAEGEMDFNEFLKLMETRLEQASRQVKELEKKLTKRDDTIKGLRAEVADLKRQVASGAGGSAPKIVIPKGLADLLKD